MTSLLALLVVLAVSADLAFAKDNVCLTNPKCYCRRRGGSAFKITCSNVTDMVSLRPLLQTKDAYSLILTNCNSLTSIPARILEGLVVRSLTLRCHLTSVDEAAFEGVHNLTYVTLDYSDLVRVPRAFVDTNVTLLQIRYGDITYLDDALQNTTSIVDLSLSRNRIRTVSGSAFAGMQDLQDLDLSYNELGVLDPETLPQVTMLRTLNLMGNQLLSLDGCLDKVNPQAINLYGNSLRSVSGVFHSNMWVLKWLDLGNNPLENVTAASFGADIHSLRILSMEQSALGALDPLLLTAFPLLQEIRLARNGLASLAEQFFQPATYLYWVDVSENSLSALDPSWFEHNYNLRRLFFAFNNLTSVGPKSLGQSLSELLTLDLSWNGIATLRSGELESLEQLHHLNLSNNPLGWLDSDSFNGMRQLKWLNLSFSMLTSLNGSLRRPEEYFNSLVGLDVSHSLLDTLDADALSGLRHKTSRFWFTGNRLETVYRAFRWFTPVELTLDDNRLTTLTEDTFNRSRPGPFKSMQYLKLAGNPWTCDCRLSWLLEWHSTLRSKKSPLKDEPLCHLPVYLRGRRFTELTVRDLTNWTEHCPAPCQCECHVDGPNTYTVANCSGMGLGAVPPWFPENNREIYLQGNDIAEFRGVNGTRLRLLDLEDNVLEEVRFLELPPSVEVLRLARNRLSRFPHRELGNRTLKAWTLSGNPWICDCESWSFGQWLVDSRLQVVDLDEVRCGSYNIWNDLFTRGKPVYSLHYDDFCGQRLVKLVAGIAVTSVLLVTLCLLCFCCRSTFAACLYGYGCTWLKRPDERWYPYDALLLAADPDQPFVCTTLAPGLENDKLGFRLCIPKRDVHGLAAANAGECLGQCCKVVVIVSRNFTDDPQCTALLTSCVSSLGAREAPLRVLLVVRDEGAAVELRQSLGACRCLRWGERLFWKKLVYLMPKGGPPTDGGSLMRAVSEGI